MEENAKDDEIILLRTQKEFCMINIKIDTLSAEAIYSHFIYCKTPIIGIDLYEHALKLRKYATTIEAWSGDQLLGMCACYMNDTINKTAYVSHIEVHSKYLGGGLGSRILKSTENLALEKGMEVIKLDVAKNNVRAIDFYIKSGYVKTVESNYKMTFCKIL